MGANSYGQLGVGYKCEQILLPETVPFDTENKNIISISGGAGHSIILDDEGFLYATGWNSKGQLGLKEECLQFTKIDSLSNFKITQISCGWDFNAALTSDGQVFVWGSNAFTQISFPKHIKCISIPTLLNVPKIKYISCGVRHMALITADGSVMICGNGNKGQLGLIDTSESIIRETELKIIPELNNIVSVACGQYHTVALRSDGTVYVWGDNKHGQLGLDPTIHERITVPHKVDLPITPTSIHAGWTHSAVMTDGEIFNFGRNNYGQLGDDNRVYSWIPRKLLNCCNVNSLRLGSEHNLAVNSDDELYSWGWNEHGNCGTGDMVDRKHPVKILTNVYYISAGTGQSFAVINN